MPSDDVTSFFANRSRGGNSRTNSTHTSVVPIPLDNGVRYIRIDPPSDGWVAGLNNSGSRVPLCEYTKVKLLEKKGDRVYFRLLDGNSEEVGNELSMKEEGAIQYLRKDTREGEIIVEVHDFNFEEKVYSVQRGVYLLQCSGEIRCDGLTIPVTLSTRFVNHAQLYHPLPVGTYSLMAPDYPHTGEYSRFYRPDRTKGQFDLVWFPIEYGDNSRYLHMGHVSEGCLTVTHINKWETLYHKIIRCRSDGNTEDKPGGGKYVAKIIVSKDSVRKPTNQQPHSLSSF
jgi:hypothetical protein